MKAKSLLLAAVAVILSGHAAQAQERKISTASIAENPRKDFVPPYWETAARLRRGLGGISGTLRIDPDGLVFRSSKGLLQQWAIVDIQTVDLWPRQVVLTGYEKRGLFRPGVRRFRFHLDKEMPPGVASELARAVGKPVRNGVPDPNVSAFETIPARHRTAFGGTRSNGTLRLTEDAIEYITKASRESRSWRWSDIETISSPDSYRLTVFGYRETYSFDLKQPLTPELFNRLSDLLYAGNQTGWTPYEGRSR